MHPEREFFPVSADIRLLSASWFLLEFRFLVLSGETRPFRAGNLHVSNGVPDPGIRAGR